MMKNKHLLWFLTAVIIILILINLNLRLKYEVEFFGYERFIHESAAKESFEFQWPESKKMALSLSFDDARTTQIDNGIPILDEYGVKATFYVLVGNVRIRLSDWKNAVENGHEIGNHTFSHPCSGNYDFIISNPLENYTMTRMFNELNIENEILKNLIGIYPKSFAYPCGQTYIGEGVNNESYVPLVSTMFESGRLYSGGTVHPVFCDMARLPSSNIDNVSFEEVKELIENAKKTGKWLILTGHDIGYDNNPQTTSSITLEEICKYANDPVNEIWIDNVHNVSSYIMVKRGEKPFEYISNYKKTTSSLYGKLWAVLYIWKMKLVDFKHSIEKK